MGRIQAEERAGIREISDEDDILRSPPPSPAPGPGGYSRRALIRILSGDDNLDEDALLASSPPSPDRELTQELMASDIELEDTETYSVPQPTTSSEGIVIKLLGTKIDDEEERLLLFPSSSSSMEVNQDHERQSDGPQLFDEDTLLLETIPQPTPNNGFPVIPIDEEDTQDYSLHLPPARNDISEDLDDEVIYISSTVASPHEVYEITDSDDEETEPFSPSFICQNEKINTPNTPLDVVGIDKEQLDESEQEKLDKREHQATPPSQISKSDLNKTNSIDPEIIPTYEIELNELELTTTPTDGNKSNKGELATTPIDNIETSEIATNPTDEIESNQVELITIPTGETTESNEPELATTPIDEMEIDEPELTTTTTDEIESNKLELTEILKCEIESNEAKLITIPTDETIYSNEPESTTTPIDEMETDEPELTTTPMDERKLCIPQSDVPELFIPYLKQEFQSEGESFDCLIEMSPYSRSTFSCDDSEDIKGLNLVQLGFEDTDQSMKPRETLLSHSTAMVVLPSPTRYEGDRNGHTANTLNEDPESSPQFSSRHFINDTLPTPKVPTWFDDPLEGPSSCYNPVDLKKETSITVWPLAHSHTKHSVDMISTGLRTSQILRSSPDTDSSEKLSSSDEFLKIFEIITDYKRIIKEQQSKKEECWASYWKTSDHAKELISNVKSKQNEKLQRGRSLKTNGNKNINRVSHQNKRDVMNFQSNQHNLNASQRYSSYLKTSNTLSTGERNLHESRDLSSENDIVTTKNIKKKQVTFRDPLEEVYEVERIVYENETKKLHGTKRKNSDSPRGPSKKLQRWKESLKNAGRSGHGNNLNLNTSNATILSKLINDSVSINQAESTHNSRDIVPGNSRMSEILRLQSNDPQIQLPFPSNFSDQHYEKSYILKKRKKSKRKSCKDVHCQNSPTKCSIWSTFFQRKDRTHKNSEENSSRNQNDSSQSVLLLAGTSNKTHTEPEQKTNKNGENKAETKTKYNVKSKDDLKITITKRKNSECPKDDKKRRSSSDIPLGIEQITPINNTNPTELQTSSPRVQNDSQRLNHQQSTERVGRMIIIPPLHEPSFREDQENMPQNRNRSPIDFCYTKNFFHDEMIQRSDDLKFFNYNVPPRLETPPSSPKYEDF